MPTPDDSTLARSREWLKKNLDLLVLFLFLLAWIDPAWFSPRALFTVRDTSLADDSWHLDQVFKLSRSLWLGRDVAFTHGPIFQWLAALPARIMGVSMGAIYATWIVLPVLCAYLCVYLTLKLLLAKEPAWKRALLLFLLLEFWIVNWDWSLQTVFPILLFAIFWRGWDSVIQGRRKTYLLGFAATLLCGTGFLISIDCGAYAVAAWTLSTAAVFLTENQKRRTCAVALSSFAISAVIFAMAINAAIGRVFDFRFWRDGEHIVSVYRWATPSAMSDASTVRLLGIFLAGAAAFLIRAATRTKQNPVPTDRLSFLVGGFCFAIVMLQSALVRSDYWHAANGALALVLLTGTILFTFQSYRLSLAAILLAIVASLQFGSPAFGPGTVLSRIRQLRQPAAGCPAGLREFDRACFTPKFATVLESAAHFVGEHSTSHDPIIVFPYQTMFGIASQRNVAGGLLQPYAASGDYLSKLQIAGQEKSPAPAALYATDVEWNASAEIPGLSPADLFRWRDHGMSRPIDGIYNFTRTPELWFWMQRHYRLDQELTDGIFGLLPDNSRDARFSTQAHDLGLARPSFPIRARNSVVDLGSPNWPIDADLLRLRLTVRYPLWWKFRKPVSLQLELKRSDGTSDLRNFIVPPNQSSEVWIYPWNQADLPHYLDADENHWRPTPRPAITNLRIIATPLDWVSVVPEALVLEGADSVRIDLLPPHQP